MLSTRIALPGADARKDAISAGVKAFVLTRDGDFATYSHFVNGMHGEYAGAGDKSVCVERASKTSFKGFDSCSSCSKNALPTPPTPFHTISNPARLEIMKVKREVSDPRFRDK